MDELKRYFDAELAKHAKYGSIEEINDNIEEYSSTIKLLISAYDKQFQDINKDDLINRITIITNPNELDLLSQQIDIMKLVFNGTTKLVLEGKKHYESILSQYRNKTHELRTIKSDMYDDDVYQLLLILSNSIVENEVVINYKFNTTEIEAIYNLLSDAPVSDKAKVEYTSKLVEVLKKQLFIRQEIVIKHEETEQAEIEEEVIQLVQEHERENENTIIIPSIFYDMIKYADDISNKVKGEFYEDIVKWFINEETPIDWDTRLACYRRTTTGAMLRKDNPDFNTILYDLITYIDPNEIIKNIKNNELSYDEVKEYKKIYRNIILLYKKYLKDHNLPDDVELNKKQKPQIEQPQVEAQETQEIITPSTPERIIRNIEEFFTDEQIGIVDKINRIKTTLLEALEILYPNKSYESLVNLWNTGQREYINVPEIVGKILFVDIPKYDEQFNFCVFTNNERDSLGDNWEEQLQSEINGLFNNPGITDKILNEYDLYLENLDEENRRRREEEHQRQEEELRRQEEYQQLVSSNPQYNLIIVFTPSIDEKENIVEDVNNAINEYGNIVTKDKTFDNIKYLETKPDLHTDSVNVKGQWENPPYAPRRYKSSDYRFAYIKLSLHDNNKEELIKRYNIDPEKASRFSLILLTNMGYKPNDKDDIYKETNHRISVTKERIDYIIKIFKEKFNDTTRQEAFDLIDNGSPEVVLGKTPRV